MRASNYNTRTGTFELRRSKFNSYFTTMEVLSGGTAEEVQSKWEAGEFTLQEYLNEMAKAMIRRGDSFNEVQLWIQHFLAQTVKES